MDRQGLEEGQALMPALKYRTTMPRPDDPQIQQAVAASILLGHPIDTAGQLAGLGSTVAYDWNSKGLADIKAGEPASPHATFAKVVKQAEAEMVDAKLKQIEAATKVPGKGWLPAMTLLERRRPQDFGRNQRIEIESNTTVTYRLELNTDAARAIAQNILTALTESDIGGLADTPTPLLAEHTEPAQDQD